MIKTQPLSEAQFREFWPHLLHEYAQLIASRVGIPIEMARADAERELAMLLPQGRETPGRWIHAVLCAQTSEHVGYAFWGADTGKKHGFIYHVQVFPPYQGRGFGAAIFRWLDDALREAAGCAAEPICEQR